MRRARFSVFKRVIKAPQPKTITGKIAVTPNPVPSDEGSPVVVSWETNDPSGGEIRVSTSDREEKLVTRGGKRGRVEIDWIADSTEYEFRLYPASQPDRELDRCFLNARPFRRVQIDNFLDPEISEGLFRNSRASYQQTIRNAAEIQGVPRFQSLLHGSVNAERLQLVSLI